MPLRSSIYWFVILGLISFFPLPANGSVLLSEIQVSGDKAADEFVELYNSGSEAISLNDYSLRRKSQGDLTAKGSSLKTFGSGDTIPARGYFLWASSSGIFKDHADVTTGGGLADNNSLGLFDAESASLDSLTWGSSHTIPFAPTSFDNPEKKESFVRDLDDFSWKKTKSISPTNSQGEIWQEEVLPEPEPTPFTQIVINEVFANPKEKGDLGEFIELYNPLSTTVELAGWEIRDASASGKYVFPSGAKIVGLGYLVITDQDFTLSLNNGKESLTLFDAEKRAAHTVSYEKTKEGITLNLVGDKLRGGKVPTPGEENILNTDPVTKERVPKKGYRDIAVEFSAKGQDSDGDSLKYTWNFGDDHKSYKAKTSHKYQKTGRYTVTLTTDDGTDTTTETFQINIEKYEAPKLRIVALMPNPKGNDSDLEWIEIENREKKAVNLKDFGIATGSKKKSLVNHPIRSDIEITGKSAKRLTRDDALFAFNNKKGHIELRAPNGDVIHSIKYKYDQSLKEGITLKKVKGQPLIAIVSANDDGATETTESPATAATPITATAAAEVPTNTILETLGGTVDEIAPIPPEVKGASTAAESSENSHPIATQPRTWTERLLVILNTWFNQ